MLLCLCGCDNEDDNLMICGVAKDNCDLVPDPGHCMAYMPRYYFDKTEGKCKEFIWGGCGGVVPFNTMEECLQCEQTKNK
ncbi:BPTI/Kunitz domain-containing protein [Fulvivirgaceae bacterium PWU4]|uniref:BPTI/Kunitz domain-containing protein n=2 Tax=Chryseosolibacter histidini TaxID=2782349 RepID=A0AAP2DTI0_9BACT|nr:BPTI/Kunitz domain-containing protein [Chryseosolibacter histidini]